MSKIHKATIWNVFKLWRLFNYALKTDFTYFSRAYVDQIKHQNSLPRFIAALIRRNRVLFVSHDGSQINGYAIGAVPKTGEGELYWLYVHPDRRGQNLGLKLLAAIFKDMRRLRARKVRIVTYNNDEYYFRQGFQPVGIQVVDGLELKRMEYPLFPDKVRTGSRSGRSFLLFLLLLAVSAGVLISPRYQEFGSPFNPPAKPIKPGKILQIIDEHHLSQAEVAAKISQNYGETTSKNGVKRLLFTYSSLDLNNRPITIHARAYLPDNHSSTPIFALAPGTTGIGDDCAASLEQPQTRNWANYESHALAYANQGYTTVITDYEGMRDSGRLHHYMVGPLEGRAVLDSLRAVKNLPQAKSIINPSQVLVGGYSQGGHSVFWADKINSAYAPDIKLAGVIGWGPVMDVKQTWQDITKGANINWFGPYVLTSYADHYKTQYQTENILLPQWIARLQTDVTSHCIDTNIQFWGRIPASIYTEKFLADLGSGNLPAGSYGSLDQDLNSNIVGDQPTATAKLINYGDLDNVVLPSQQINAKPRLCSNSRGPVTITPYPHDTHYSVMKSSFAATLSWMRQSLAGTQVPDSCL